MFKYLNIIAFTFLFVTLSYAGDPDAELLQFDVRCKIKKGILYREYSYLIQINNRLGDKYARINIYNTKRGNISRIEGCIEDLNGNVIRKIKPGDIKKLSLIGGISLYTDDYYKTFELRHNEYPYRIRYSYTEVYSEFFEIISWNPVLDEKVPVRKASLTVESPKEYSLKIKTQGNLIAKVDTLPSAVKLSYQITDFLPVWYEKYAPSLYNLAPSVYIVPENFIWLYSGSNKDWQSLGNWKYKLIDGKDALPDHEKRKVEYLIQGISDDREKVKILYHYLQDNTRYVSLDIKTGGLVPYPAEYVSYNKYGDCKALSNYMKALLQVVNIQAYYTNIYADENPPDIDVNFPRLCFNHVIVTVPLKNDTIFLECTKSTNPFGYVGTFIQNRPSLLIDNTDSHLLYTPGLNPADNLLIRSFNFNVQPTGTALTDIHYNAKGRFFEEFDGISSDLNQTEQEKYIKYFIIPFGDYNLNKWQINRINRDSAVILFSAEAELYHVIKEYGKDKIIKPFPVFSMQFEIPGKRKLPVNIPYPLNYIDSLVYQFPKQSNDSLLISEVNIDSRFGKYFKKATFYKDQLFINRQFILYRGEYKLEEYPEFYRFINNMQNADQQNIVLPF